MTAFLFAHVPLGARDLSSPVSEALLSTRNVDLGPVATGEKEASKFEALVAGTFEATVAGVLGRTVLNAVIVKLKTECGLETSEICANAHQVRTILSKFFGTGGLVIERCFIRRLYSELGITSKPTFELVMDLDYARQFQTSQAA